MNENEALRTIDEYMIHKSLGASGSKIVFEEFMTGEEMSIFLSLMETILAINGQRL